MTLALKVSICDDMQKLTAISWSLMAQENAADACSGCLLRIIENRGEIDARDLALVGLSNICKSVFVQDGVLLYCNHVVVPLSLHGRVLRHIHAAHQGISAMEQRACAIIY